MNATAAPPVDLSVVIPAYNEAENLPPLLAENQIRLAGTS